MITLSRYECPRLKAAARYYTYGMNNRVLGTTGYEISEIGFGSWGLGGDDWRGVQDADARAAIAEAIRQGVNFFDTALAYGDGHSERMIARVLREEEARSRVVVATKIPPLNYEWPGDGAKAIGEIFPPQHILACVEKSCQHLEVDALQIEQLHVWHDAWLANPEWEETYYAMTRLREQGKVLHWGISVNDHAPETALRILKDPLFESAQVIYNIYERAPEQTIFSMARSGPLGIIARVPLDEGALTGTIKADTAFLDGDWRKNYFRGNRKAEAARRVEALDYLLGEEATTVSELALRFCLSSPAVTTVIPGMRRAEHVRANTAVSDGRILSRMMLSELKKHSWVKNWYQAD